MLSKEQMLEKLHSMGLKRSYKPFIDGDSCRNKILLKTRKPPLITNGVMRGSEIDIYDDNTVRVWTSQKKKAKAVADENGFRVRLLDGEAELYLPADRADEFLHAFGAKVKTNRVFTPEQKVRLAVRFAEARKKALATPL